MNRLLQRKVKHTSDKVFLDSQLRNINTYLRILSCIKRLTSLKKKIDKKEHDLPIKPPSGDKLNFRIGCSKNSGNFKMAE